MYDIRKVRRDFPILDRRVGNKKLVYLDNAATSPRNRGRFWTLSTSTTRSTTPTSTAVSTAWPRRPRPSTKGPARGWLGFCAPDVMGLIFTRGTTESINLVAHAWGRKNLREGDEILLTEAEHHSNLVPWQLAARPQARGCALSIREDGTLDMEVASRLIGPRTKMVGCIHSSNVLATVNPVGRLADLAHSVGALMLVDGAQSAPHMPVDVVSLGCDFFACSGHKMLGPTGVGVLWGRPEILDAMDPFLGGEMIREVHLEHSTWNELPHSSRPGP